MSAPVFFQEKNLDFRSTAKDISRLRYEAFVERLNWDIESNNELERDSFDNLNPFHVAIRSEEGQVAGCWRALPTSDKYMLKDVFPQLLQGEKAPQLADVWEISRFAVRKGNGCAGPSYISSVTIDLVRSFHEFAQQNGVRAYVTVTTVACERLLRQLGVSLRRLGKGKSIQIGKEKSVALWIDVDEKLAICTH